MIDDPDRLTVRLIRITVFGEIAVLVGIDDEDVYRKQPGKVRTSWHHPVLAPRAALTRM